jgi:hypothetical protein
MIFGLIWVGRATVDERIVELDCILEYAASIRDALVKGRKPFTAEVQRLSQLSQEIEREFDSQWQKWCDNLSCT